jgi:hypothetical protein
VQATIEAIVEARWWVDAASIDAVSDEDGPRLVEGALRRAAEELFGFPHGRSKVSLRSPVRIVDEEVVDLEVVDVDVQSIDREEPNAD